MVSDRASPRWAWVFTAAIFAAIVISSGTSILALPAMDDAKRRGVEQALQSLAAEEMVLRALRADGSLTQAFFEAETDNIADARKDLEDEL